MSSIKKLRNDAMGGKWSEVFESCKKETALWTTKITGMGDTLLHMAVSEGKKKLVVDMVDFLVEQEKSLPKNNVVVTVDEDVGERWNVSTVLGAENDRKNTPLHIAARKGNVETCKKIGGVHASLIVHRNIAGETPLFLAALNGRTEAFLWRHYLYVRSPEVRSTDFPRCIRDNNDDTILHCAIAEGQADVAIEIVHLYKDHLKEMIMPNKAGLSPLHILAANRLAFKSTALLHLPSLAHPIYRRCKVEEKKQATTFEELLQAVKDKKKNILSKFRRWICFIPLVLLRAVRYSLTAFLLSTFSEVVRIRWVSLFLIPPMKEAHTRWHQIMTLLLQHASKEDMSQIVSRTVPEKPSTSLQTKKDNEPESMATTASGTTTVDTPLMIATKNGVIEMVVAILELFPSTIQDVDSEGKNILLLAVEYRQTDVYRFLCEQEWLKESLFGQVDKEGNNALHLAVSLEVDPNQDIGEAINMEWHLIFWVKLVRMSLPCGLLSRYNSKMETPEIILTKSHNELQKIERDWVAKTSKACSVVSTLVVSVAFATRTNVPGSYDDDKGYAILRNQPQAFKIFKDSSFVALFFSLMSTMCFISIVASPHQYFHPWKFTPSRFYWGVYFMFASIICLWISFCAADFFLLHGNDLKLHKALPTYILLSSGFILMVVLQLPKFLDHNKLLMALRTPAARTVAISPIQYRRTENKENRPALDHQN